MVNRPDWKRVQVGDIVTGFDTQYGKFTGTVTKYAVLYPVRRNLPPIVMATVIESEFSSEIKVNVEKLNEAYDITRPLVHTDIKALPLYW